MAGESAWPKLAPLGRRSSMLLRWLPPPPLSLGRRELLGPRCAPSKLERLSLLRGGGGGGGSAA